MVSLVCISRAELALFLLYRVLRRGKDDRFDAVRENFFPFLAFWIFQMVWAFGVSLPVIFVAAEPDPPSGQALGLGPYEWAGFTMWAIGFLVQVAADLQKDSFRANPANKGKVCDVGVWRYSRHPNFFGEIFLWWGIFVACARTFNDSAARLGGSSWGYAGIISPLLTMLILLKFSGMPTAEGDNQKRFMRTTAAKEWFLAYRQRTSPLIPLPTSLYVAIPLVIKQWLLFELKEYEADWDSCGDVARDTKACVAAGQGKGVDGGEEAEQGAVGLRGNTVSVGSASATRQSSLSPASPLLEKA